MTIFGTGRFRVLIGFLPQSPAEAYAQAHITPIPDYIFRFYLSGRAWPYAKWFADRAKARAMVVRLNMDGDISSHFGVRLNQDGDAELNPDSLGRLTPHIHFVDSSILPNSPAQPVTFTIMANAARIVSEVMNG